MASHGLDQDLRVGLELGHYRIVERLGGGSMGVMVGGKLYQGHAGTAGEIGHTVVAVDGRRCSCGKRGCLMAYVSGLALRHRALERIQSGEEST